MFEKSVSPGPLPALPGATLSTAALGGLVGRLGRLDTEVDDAERITQLELLERPKGAAAAAQARVSVALDRSQRADQAAQGLPSGKRGRGVAEQIALARHDSTSKGSRHLGLARVLVNEMPHTLAALTAGRISEWRATIMAGETATLTLEDRQEVDARLADELPRLGDRQLAARAKALGYQLDAKSMLRRIRGAVSDRRVSIRPAPDTMALVTGFLPVAQGVAVHAALVAAAAAARAQGDQRSKGQIMADTFVERLTGQRTADAVPLEVQLVMTDRTLLAGDSTPAQIPGYGPAPAAYGRDLVARRWGQQPDDAEVAASEAGTAVADLARVWLRRLYTAPADGTLVAMDSRRRAFDGLLRRFLVTRDQVCRTPWCDAPVRHTDHIVPAARGGTSTADNGQGLCERCNYAKELPGWHAEVARAPQPASGRHARHRVVTTTPTGHTYDSLAPPVLGLPPHDDASPLEVACLQLLAA